LKKRVKSQHCYIEHTYTRGTAYLFHSLSEAFQSPVKARLCRNIGASGGIRTRDLRLTKAQNRASFDFRAFCEVDLQLAPRTVRDHLGRIKRFSRVLGKAPSEISSEDIRGYLANFQKDRAPATYAGMLKRCGHVGMLKMFFTVNIKALSTTVQILNFFHKFCLRYRKHASILSSRSFRLLILAFIGITTRWDRRVATGSLVCSRSFFRASKLKVLLNIFSKYVSPILSSPPAHVLYSSIGSSARSSLSEIFSVFLFMIYSAIVSFDIKAVYSILADFAQRADLSWHFLNTSFFFLFFA
jgi:hypothetical protein